MRIKKVLGGCAVLVGSVALGLAPPALAEDPTGGDLTNCRTKVHLGGGNGNVCLHPNSGAIVDKVQETTDPVVAIVEETTDTVQETTDPVVQTVTDTVGGLPTGP